MKADVFIEKYQSTFVGTLEIVDISYIYYSNFVFLLSSKAVLTLSPPSLFFYKNML